MRDIVNPEMNDVILSAPREHCSCASWHCPIRDPMAVKDVGVLVDGEYMVGRGTGTDDHRAVSRSNHVRGRVKHPRFLSGGSGSIVPISL